MKNNAQIWTKLSAPKGLPLLHSLCLLYNHLKLGKLAGPVVIQICIWNYFMESIMYKH